MHVCVCVCVGKCVCTRATTQKHTPASHHPEAWETLARHSLVILPPSYRSPAPRARSTRRRRQRRPCRAAPGAKAQPRPCSRRTAGGGELHHEPKGTDDAQIAGCSGQPASCAISLKKAFPHTQFRVVLLGQNNYTDREVPLKGGGLDENVVVRGGSGRERRARTGVPHTCTRARGRARRPARAPARTHTVPHAFIHAQFSVIPSGQNGYTEDEVPLEGGGPGENAGVRGGSRQERRARTGVPHTCTRARAGVRARLRARLRELTQSRTHLYIHGRVRADGSEYGGEPRHSTARAQARTLAQARVRGCAGILARVRARARARMRAARRGRRPLRVQSRGTCATTQRVRVCAPCFLPNTVFSFLLYQALGCPMRSILPVAGRPKIGCPAHLRLLHYLPCRVDNFCACHIQISQARTCLGLAQASSYVALARHSARSSTPSRET